MVIYLVLPLKLFHRHIFTHIVNHIQLSIVLNIVHYIWLCPWPLTLNNCCPPLNALSWLPYVHVCSVLRNVEKRRLWNKFCLSISWVRLYKCTTHFNMEGTFVFHIQEFKWKEKCFVQTGCYIIVIVQILVNFKPELHTKLMVTHETLSMQKKILLMVAYEFYSKLLVTAEVYSKPMVKPAFTGGFCTQEICKS